MADILKLPVQASKLGYRRVRKRCKATDPNQLDLFAAPAAQILSFTAGLGPFEQALLWDERGDARAAELYSEAIEKEDCVSDAFCNLGIIESKRGNPVKALDCFTAALKNDPRHLEAHYNLGNLYFDLDDLGLAKVHFEMAVNVDPDFANAYFNLALIQVINHDPGAAVEALARYQQLVPPDEGRKAEKLLEELEKCVSAARKSGTGTS